ncbi:patatin-like phospholipase family protein [Acuticoccus sp. I52.16.1]|uniref:patatin-like phospholipase family protein n=1 Tax=Acuticoccus sp. I52.16.1 TaxID=2928472 RepID=UPI001FD0F167|nr:patatin-like phospholipase family protein [Acuticoccus sp. I52.16.1]UOM34318.1 patatin-like phospholipase family protein [Acuticoccus sp. I52.16.1]
MGKLRVLAMDGGYRPLVMCLLLARLEALRPGLLDTVDVFSGTSAGSAAAAMMSLRETPQEGLADALEVFRAWNPLEGTSPLSPRTLGAISGVNAFLTHELLYREMLGVLGDTRISETRRRVVIPTVELDNEAPNQRLRRWTIRVYHNLSEPFVHKTRLVDVVLRSSSIPMLQPAYQGHADGGLYANNPALIALGAAHDFLGAELEEVQILSIGQGEANHFIDLPRGDVGYGTWLLDPNDPMAFLNLVLDLNRQATDYQLSRILEDRFVRLNPVLTRDTRPRPDITAAQFAFEQELVAQEIDVESTVLHLDRIGWFAPGEA